MFWESLALDLLLVFAVFRLTRLFVAEHGIFGIFTTIRRKAGVYETTVKQQNVVGQFVEIPVNDADNAVGKILTCFYCCSVWVSIPAAILVASISDGAMFNLYIWFAIHWLSIAGGAIVVKEST